PAEQYIFQRRTSALTEPSGHDESSSLYVEVGLTESDTKSDEEIPPVVKSGDQDEGQARPDPGIQDKGQAEPNPDDVIKSQPLSTPGVHAGPNLEHTDAKATAATMRKAVDEIVTDAVDWVMQAPLRERFRDLPEVDMKEILHNRMWEFKSYQTHKDHMTLYEALEKSMARYNSNQLLSDLVEARKKKKKRHGSPKTPPVSPPPPPPPAGPSGTSRAFGASGSSQSPPPPPPSSNNQGGQSISTAAPKLLKDSCFS
ncbi:hypothetical protein Tco_1518239, partial [Tanacetum coccineum]